MVKFPIKIKLRNFKPIFIINSFQTLVDLATLGLVETIHGEVRETSNEIYISTMDRYEEAIDEEGCYESDYNKLTSYCPEEVKLVNASMIWKEKNLHGEGNDQPSDKQIPEGEESLT